MTTSGFSKHVAQVLSAAEHRADADPRIAASWRRCLVDHRLDPARCGPPHTLTEAEISRVREPVEELIRMALPELEALARVLREAGYCVNFADVNANVLVSYLPGGDYETTFREVGIYTGSNFAEAFEGTNGVGTALAEQRPILVHRDEHFRDQWKFLTCAVTPLFDHHDQPVGAVNISSCRGDFDRAAHQLAFAITSEATWRIQHAIFRRRFDHAWIATLPGDDGRGLIAYDDDRRIIGACRRGRSILGLTNGFESGVELSRFIRLGDANVRTPSAAIEFRRADGTLIGHGHITPPAARPVFATRSVEATPRRIAALSTLAGSDPALAKSVKRLTAVVDLDLPILLRGETGTGKDVFARAIHAASGRANKSFVALNCAALPESLIDAELFGYEAGAFTGARREGAKGLIVQASGGTLFLDEIGDMPLALQTRLLRVLENREVWPLGGRKPVPVDIRLISATNRDLAAMVEAGTFRSDLYYRLLGVEVRLPALRERSDKADLIARIAREEAPHCGLSAGAQGTLLSYPFPGNIRQLRYALRLAGGTAENGLIEAADLDLPPVPGAGRAEPDHATAEYNAIVQALRDHGGRVGDAAQALAMSRATLYRKIKGLKIKLDD